MWKEDWRSGIGSVQFGHQDKQIDRTEQSPLPEAPFQGHLTSANRPWLGDCPIKWEKLGSRVKGSREEEQMDSKQKRWSLTEERALLEVFWDYLFGKSVSGNTQQQKTFTGTGLQSPLYSPGERSPSWQWVTMLKECMKPMGSTWLPCARSRAKLLDMN